MNWPQRNPAARVNQLEFWTTCTVLWSIFVGLALSTVVIGIAKGNRAWLMAGLVNMAIGILNARSCARSLHSAAASRADNHRLR
jgi:hypothetical protein